MAKHKIFVKYESFIGMLYLFSFLEPPPTPQNLTILEISSRSVKIAWSLDRNASPGVERLVIQWKEQSGKCNKNDIFSSSYYEQFHIFIHNN